jgi:bifunctional polynucleotide phosphatase/kinase
VSNQAIITLKKDPKLGADSKSFAAFKTKVANVFESLNVPISIYAATEYDEYRKPRLGMWKELVDDYDLDVEDALDLEGSIFVGDAAGRPGDHSACDRYVHSHILGLWKSTN